MAVTKKIIHKVTDDEVKQCWEFGLKYFLDDTKSTQNRTGGQNRGVGGVLDSFMNKIVEIAVCKELSKLNKSIDCLPDFEIHALNKGKTEPDVYKIVEKKYKKERNPNVYVEIKNISDADNWLGPKADEIESIQNNDYKITDTKKMFYVYGELVDSKHDSNKRHSSILGAYMKKLIPGDPVLMNFHDVSDLSVEIKYVFSVHDIQKLGVSFPKGGYMVSPEIFVEPAAKTKIRIRNNMKSGQYKKMNVGNKTLPKETGAFLTKAGREKTRLPYPKSFGDIKFKGKIEMHEEKLSSLVNHFFYCLNDVAISSDVLGDWNFKKGDVQNYRITYSGRDPELIKNNTFVARRNQKITDRLGAIRLAEIAKSI
ncbi:hypothetical protein [Nitrosopumilus sp.]|uniref:hypothetical protein n=1 Tax=Nitrosopumilus sp. TaxID=2024843 RepID=UPI00349FE83D